MMCHRRTDKIIRIENIQPYSNKRRTAAMTRIINASSPSKRSAGSQLRRRGHRMRSPARVLITYAQYLPLLGIKHQNFWTG
ncbi:MAG: hypothetical protein ACKPKO_26370, partial [Candidatus Fonsibacter sp.]